jgi:hypothetical protein
MEATLDNSLRYILLSKYRFCLENVLAFYGGIVYEVRTIRTVSEWSAPDLVVPT